ncbi:MAG: hypothetical protein C0483_19820 [Pirellula sp.]|nr:hypothetical protein [Pirellula sp.]
MKISQSSGGKANAEPNRHYGTVDGIYGDTVVTVGDSGQQHSHRVALDCELSCYGKACELSDIPVGARVQIAVQPGDEDVAIKVECLRTPGSS